MFCPQCGNQNPDSATTCAGCGAPLGRHTPSAPPQAVQYASQPRHDVPNYLVRAILTAIFCCMPFGIVAIVYAAQVNGYVASGNYAAAEGASANAKKWSGIAFGVGLVLGILSFILQVAGGVAQG